MENKQNDNIIALMDFFVVLKKLNKFYTFDQSLEVMDAYIRYGDPNVITTEDNLRDYVIANNFRDIISQQMIGKYNHLADYLADLGTNNISKIK